MAKTKTLIKMPVAIIKELTKQNWARKKQGLSQLKVTIRECLLCDTPFESIEARTCGCAKDSLVIPYQGD